MSGSTGVADTFGFYGRLMSIRVSTPARSSASEAPAGGRIRALGLVCAVGGLLGAASVVPMLAVPPMVGPDRFSYPFDAGWHIAAEVFFALQHLTLLAGVVGLAAYCGRYGSRLVRAGLVVAGLGVVTLVGCEVLAATAAYEPSDSPWAMTVGSLYGVAMLLIGVGLMIAGLVIARRRMLTGWARWITLATGGYVFVVLFPAVFGPNVAGRLAIGGWMLAWAAVGWAVARSELDGGVEQDD
jgi:hypothetical protein